MRDGLPNNTVYAVIADHKGNALVPAATKGYFLLIRPQAWFLERSLQKMAARGRIQQVSFPGTA